MAKESLRSWHEQKRYVEEHYHNPNGVRFRPTGEPAMTVQTSSGPLEFTNLTRLYGLRCFLVPGPQQLRFCSSSHSRFHCARSSTVHLFKPPHFGPVGTVWVGRR